MEGEDLEEASASPGSKLKQRCACCLLILLLPLVVGGLAFSTWRSEARAETDLVRARLQARWDRPDLHTPAMKPEVAQLLDIASECERLEISDALHSLRGSPISYVRAALNDPADPNADITYEPDSPADPPTLLAAIAALKSATASLDVSLDSLVDWEVIQGQRLRQALWTSKDDPDWDRYMALSGLSYQLRDRIMRASVAGDHPQAWLEVEHLAQVHLLLAEPTSLFTHLITRLRIGVLVSTILAQLTEGPPPTDVAQRLSQKLLVLEGAVDPRRPLLGELLQSEERLRADPDEAVAVALKPPAMFQKAEVTLESRARGLLVLDPLIRDYLLRGEELLDAGTRHDRLLDFLPEAEGICSSPGTPFAKTFLEPYPKAIRLAIRTLALLRLTRLAIEIARGQEPPQLEDPWSHERLPLRWEKRKDGRLWIWSRGPDCQDDGAALSEDTQENEKEYPSPILEQNPSSYEEDVDLVRALPLGG